MCSNILQQIQNDVMTYGDKIGNVTELQDYQRIFSADDLGKVFRQVYPPIMQCAQMQLSWYKNHNKESLDFGMANGLWDWIHRFNGNCHNSDYGRYVYSETGIPNVCRMFKHDRFTRNAQIPFMSKQHCHFRNTDRLCTYNLSFSIRNDELKMTINMRSSDSVKALIYDLNFFYDTMLKIYDVLKSDDEFSTLKLGQIVYRCDNVHVFEADEHIVEKMYA